MGVAFILSIVILIACPVVVAGLAVVAFRAGRRVEGIMWAIIALIFAVVVAGGLFILL